MKITCLNCGKKIDVMRENGICIHCGYYNKQSLVEPVKKDWQDVLLKPAATDAPLPISGSENNAKRAKRIFAVLMICIVLVFHLAALMFFLRMKSSGYQKDKNGEVMKEGWITLANLGGDIPTDLMNDGEDYVIIQNAYIMAWDKGGLPDGYRLVCVPYEFTKRGTAYYYEVYMKVPDHYVMPVSSRTIEDYIAASMKGQSEEAVEKELDRYNFDSFSLKEYGTVAFLVPEIYSNGSFYIYVYKLEGDKKELQKKVACEVEWGEVN